MIFTEVCHSVQGGSHVTITHDALDLTVQGPPWPSARARSKNSATNHRKPVRSGYGVGTEGVRRGYGVMGGGALILI